MTRELSCYHGYLQHQGNRPTNDVICAHDTQPIRRTKQIWKSREGGWGRSLAFSKLRPKKEKTPASNGKNITPFKDDFLSFNCCKVSLKLYFILHEDPKLSLKAIIIISKYQPGYQVLGSLVLGAVDVELYHMWMRQNIGCNYIK